MAELELSIPEVRARAAQIRRLNHTMAQTIDSAASILLSLEESWPDPQLNALRAGLLSAQPRFNSRQEVVESYAKFLDNTAAQREAAAREAQAAAQLQF